jgi:Family of unknown function (DUF6527)
MTVAKHAPIVGTPLANPPDFDLTDPPGAFFIDEDGAKLTFICPCGKCYITLPLNGGGWTWDGNREYPTISPSIRRMDRCHWHGYLKAGVWEPCGDSGASA